MQTQYVGFNSEGWPVIKTDQPTEPEPEWIEFDLSGDQLAELIARMENRR